MCDFKSMILIILGVLAVTSPMTVFLLGGIISDLIKNKKKEKTEEEKWLY